MRIATLAVTASLLWMSAGTALAACPPEATTGAPTAARETTSNSELQKMTLGEAELRKKKFVLERDIRQLRLRHFVGVRNTSVREQGWEKFKEFAKDPVALPILLDVFAGEDEAFRTRMLTTLTDIKSQPTDTAVAWVAMTETNDKLRASAMDHIQRRTNENAGEVPYGIQSVIAVGLEGADNKRAANAANMALTLKLYEAIPSMIAAQARNSAAGEPGAGAIAQIYIGTQRAFVSDLTPIVGDGAVAFDPTVSTVTEGVVLRVFDAFVITYRTEVHRALVGLSSQGLNGKPIVDLGYDQAKWKKWYEEEFLPQRAAIEREKAGKVAPAAGPAAAPAAKPAQVKEVKAAPGVPTSDTI